MEKNYYQILQIDKEASQDIIEKAYKTLAKKYHPDLQAEENKKHAENILKKINEAYEVLSNPSKREAYNKTIEQSTISQEQYKEIIHQNEYLKNKLKNNSSVQNSNSNNNLNFENYYNKKIQDLEYQENLQKARQRAYYDAYIQDLKSRGYKIKYKKTLKEYLKNLISLIITIFIISISFFILWQIPIVKRFLLELYNENQIIKGIIDIFIKKGV